MTPEELQRVLRTEADYQRNIEAIRNGEGSPAFALLLVVIVLIVYFIYGPP
jgi:hypothetical protein